MIQFSKTRVSVYILHITWDLRIILMPCLLHNNMRTWGIYCTCFRRRAMLYSSSIASALWVGLDISLCRRHLFHFFFFLNANPSLFSLKFDMPCYIHGVTLHIILRFYTLIEFLVSYIKYSFVANLILTSVTIFEIYLSFF